MGQRRATPTGRIMLKGDKKWNRAGILLSLFFLILFSACQKEEAGQKEKVPFSVCKETELPDKVRKLIEEKREAPFRFTYEDSAHLYMAVGYGKQPVGEYVAAIKEIYQQDGTIYVDTTLVSLSHGAEWKVGEPSVYPYVVIRCEKNSKSVCFLP